ncbi:hypothetical protein N9499_03310 [Octadecabacter sp.]|nr:hypothetical protein [Octadecabacter sp.]
MTDWTPAYAYRRASLADKSVTVANMAESNSTTHPAQNRLVKAATHVQVTATVLDNRIVTSTAVEDGAETHYVADTFTRDDVVIKNERGVPEDFFDTHPVGTAWNIKVHPDHPRIHVLYAGQTRSTAWGHLLLSVLMAAFGAWFDFSDGNWAALRARTS